MRAAWNRAAHYWYAFEAARGALPVGRTRTLPAGHVEGMRFAQCSCAKFNSGFFNAYGRIADRDDLDFVLHLGDYIYEASQNPPASQTPGADIGRPMRSAQRVRHARRTTARATRSTTPIRTRRRMHAAHPMIATVDDHEFADGAWRGGSNEHQPERDGPWEDRKAAAFRARWEWTPTRMPDPADPSRVYRSVRFGDLAELFLIDTRSRRDQPARFEAAEDPARTQLGHEQRGVAPRGPGGSPARWKLIGNGSMFSPDLGGRLCRVGAARAAGAEADPQGRQGARPGPMGGLPGRALAVIRERPASPARW